MSVALYKFENKLENPEREIIYCQPIATEKIYEQYLEPILYALDLKLLVDGSIIKFEQKEQFIFELMRLKEYLNSSNNNEFKDYFLLRLEKIEKDIDYLLSDAQDNVEIFWCSYIEHHKLE